MSVAIDIVILLVLVGCLVQGLRRGLVGSLGSLIGLVAGGAAALVAAPPIGALLQDGTAQAALTLGVALVLVLVGLGLGSRLGSALGRPLRRSPLGPLDRVLGAGVQVAVGAVVVSLLASLAVTLRTPVVAEPLARSAVAQGIETLVPTPVTQALDEVGTTIAAAAARAGGGERPSSVR